MESGELLFYHKSVKMFVSFFLGLYKIINANHEKNHGISITKIECR